MSTGDDISTDKHLINKLECIVIELNSSIEDWLYGITSKNNKALEFEKFVFNKLTNGFKECSEIEFDYKEQSNRFPDILMLKNGANVFGIEIKTEQKSSGKNIMGGSMKESTRVIDFKKIYLIYFNIKSKRLFFARYIDVVAGVQITHQPRYFLNIELINNDQISERFFGNDGNQVKYQDPTSLSEDKYNDLKIAYLFKSGKKTDIPKKSTVRFLKYLANKEKQKKKKDEIFKYIAEWYPEYINSNKDGKYSLFKLILTKFGYIVDRDIISSGDKNENAKLRQYCIEEKLIDATDKIPNFMIKVLKYLILYFNANTHSEKWKKKFIDGQRQKDQNICEKLIDHFFENIENRDGLVKLLNPN